MECNKVLLDSVNSAARRGMGKAVIALLVLLLCSSLIAPAALLGAAGGSSGLAFSAVFAAAALLFLLIMQFGFTILLAKLYRGERAILGDLFCGFRDLKRVCLVSVFFGAAAVVLCCIIVSAGMAVLASSGQELTVESVMRAVPLLTFICLAAYWLLVMLPYAFVYFVLYDNPQYTVRQSFKTASAILRGHRLRFFGFALRAGSWWLLIAAAAYTGGFVIAHTVNASMLAEARSSAALLLSIARILDVVYFVCAYTSLIRVTMGCAAYYDGLVSDLAGTKGQTELPLQQETPALPDAFSASETDTDE